jgi:hypothetical protein
MLTSSAFEDRETKAIAEYEQPFRPGEPCEQARRERPQGASLAPLFGGAAILRLSADLMVRFALRGVVAARRYSTLRGGGSATELSVTDRSRRPGGDGEKLGLNNARVSGQVYTTQIRPPRNSN